MYLYRIKKRNDNLFYQNYRWVNKDNNYNDYEPYWSPSGCFWKRPDTAIYNLKMLFSTVDVEHHRLGFVYPVFINYDERLLELYDIVVSNVSLMAE